MFSLFKNIQDKYLEKLKKITYEINIIEPIVCAKDKLTIKESVDKIYSYLRTNKLI